MGRIAKIGDKVRVVKVHPASVGEYEVGDIFTVQDVWHLGVIDVSDRIQLFAHEYEVLANE